MYEALASADEEKKSGHGILKAPKIIGWDAVGTVESIGDKVSLFKKEILSSMPVLLNGFLSSSCPHF
ncbi:MAG: hypothetical protein ABF755_08290 [Oenococcus oeni]